MALDPNVILQGQAPQIQNPLDQAVKASTMANLIQEHQSNAIKLSEEQRDATDRQTMRDAFKSNTQSDPDGNPVVDRQGVMRDLMRANPILAQKQAMDFRQMDLEKMSKQHEMGSQIAMSINPNDEGSYLRAQSQAKQMGLPDLAQQLPKFSDPNFPSALNKFQVTMLNTKDRLEQQNKESQFQIERDKSAVEKRRLDMEIGHYNNDTVDKLSQSLKNDLDANKSRAGNFGAISEKYLQGQRLQTLQDSYKNGNMPPQQMEEFALGMANMLSGTSGAARSQVEALVPASIVGDKSKLAQWIQNEPKGANQQKFVEAMGHTVQREMGLANDQLNQIRGQRITSHQQLRQMAPDRFNSIVQSYGMDPGNIVNGQYQAPTNKSAQPPASLAKDAPAAKSKGVLSFDEWRTQKASNDNQGGGKKD